MTRPLILALATGAALLSAGAAHAGGDVFWSIGINLPNVETVLSNAPAPFYGPQRVYAPAPVYVPQRVYVPAPVYVQPQVDYRPVPHAYYGPATIAYVRPMHGLVRPHPHWVKHRHERRDWREARREDRRDDRRDNRRDHHDEYGDRFSR
jgi:hypothetical protein